MQTRLDASKLRTVAFKSRATLNYHLFTLNPSIYLVHSLEMANRNLLPLALVTVCGIATSTDQETRVIGTSALTDPDQATIPLAQYFMSKSCNERESNSKQISQYIINYFQLS